MAFELSPVSRARSKGVRDYQEDRYFTASMPEGLCFGVFDGHGGTGCANKAVRLFPGLMADAVGEPGATVPDAFRESFAKLNEVTKHMYDGCTASIAFIPWSGELVHVAVLGDSPVILQRADRSIWVAPDHNVRSNQAEVEAAKKRGGAVVGGYLVAHFSGPGLQMSRALGDVELGSVLNRTPDVSTHVLGLGSFVLVCTDGALDPGHKDAGASAQTVVQLIQAGSEARAIVNRAIHLPTEDNVTVLLVRIATKEDPCTHKEPE
jgi:serine/threonine protein phosphatase PrpC